MVNNNSYFYISGFISLSLFLFFSSVVMYMMMSTSKVDIFALKKDNYISISLDVVEIPKNSKKIVTTPVEQESIVEPGDVNIDDLFSDVWTKKIKNKKRVEKKVDNKRLLEIGKKSKKIDKKNVKEMLDKADNSKLNQNNDEAKNISTANVVNEYLARIQALVYEKFNPPSNSEGYVVKAVIELSSIGKVMDFRILNYSTNSNLNEECDKIKARLMRVLFPINPQNKSQTIIINLIPENKDQF